MKSLRSEPSLFLLLCLIIFTSVIRIRLVDVPLERDEGEYAYMAHLILQGVPPYAEAYNMKFPGIYFAYTVILACFGQTIQGIHGALLLVNMASIIMMFSIGRHLGGSWVGFTTSAAFALLTLSNRIQGTWANAEHFVLLFAIAGLLALLRFRNSQSLRTLVLGGILFGLATTVKQHGFFLALAGSVLAVSFFKSAAQENPRRVRTLIPYLIGFAVPLILTSLAIYFSGTFDRFIFWTITYARAYAAILDFSDVPHYFRSGFLPLFYSSLLIWLVAGVGVLGVFMAQPLKHHRIVLITLLGGGILAVTPGFLFRPHYFLLLIPAVAVAFGFGVEFLRLVFARSQFSWLRTGTAVIVAILSLLTTITAHADIFFTLSAETVTRLTYGGQPFALSIPVAQFIRDRTQENDTIGMVGSEPQIPFYARRRSASGYLYLNPITEPQPYAKAMREEFFGEIESTRPGMLLYTHLIPESYEVGEGEQEVRTWFRQFAGKYYKPVARYEWTPGYEASDKPLTAEQELLAPPRQPYFIALYERLDTAEHK